jgi:hypothetical protein
VDEDDAHDYPTVIALDPGGTTGWCVMMIHPDALKDPEISIVDNIMHYEQGQFEGAELDQAEEIIQLLQAWDNAVIVCEDFQLREITAELSPVRIRAMIEMYLRLDPEEDRPIWLQMPALAKGTITDQRLKQWKLYRPGQEHARDALRHSIMFFRRASAELKIRRTAWPEIYGSSR